MQLIENYRSSLAISSLIFLIPVLLIYAVQNQPETTNNYDLSLKTGLSTGQYFQHYYSDSGKLSYSCISDVELTSDECLAQHNLRILRNQNND